MTMANPLAFNPTPDYWRNIVQAQAQQMDAHHDAMADLKAGKAPTTLDAWIKRYGFVPPGGDHFFEEPGSAQPAQQTDQNARIEWGS